MVFNTRTKESKDNWETPKQFFDLLYKEFHFTLDPCSSHENHKCKKYYTIEDNGLEQSWKGEKVFCNPPYDNIGNWCKKAYEEWKKDSLHTLIVLLIPNRTDTKYFPEYCMRSQEIRFVKGRISFELNGKPQGSPNFGSLLVIFDSMKAGTWNYPFLRHFFHKEEDLKEINNRNLGEWM